MRNIPLIGFGYGVLCLTLGRLNFFAFGALTVILSILLSYTFWRDIKEIISEWDIKKSFLFSVPKSIALFVYGFVYHVLFVGWGEFLRDIWEDIKESPATKICIFMTLCALPFYLWVFINQQQL